MVGGALAARRPFVCNDAEAEQRISRPHHRPRGHPLVHERPAGARRPRLRAGERQQHGGAGLRRARPAGGRRARPPRGERPAERAPVRAGAPHRRDPAAGADRRGAAAPSTGSSSPPSTRRRPARRWAATSTAPGRSPDGRLALLVGDVSGKGVEAAGTTAMVRYMAEALSQSRCEPAEVVDRAERAAAPAPARRRPGHAGARGRSTPPPGRSAGAAPATRRRC